MKLPYDTVWQAAATVRDASFRLAGIALGLAVFFLCAAVVLASMGALARGLATAADWALRRGRGY